MPTRYSHGRSPSSSGARSLRWRAKESRELGARGMTTTSRRRPGPGEPGDESGSPREDRGRDGLHRGNRAGDRDRAGSGGRVGRRERADAGARDGRDRADPANRGRRTGTGGGGGPGDSERRGGIRARGARGGRAREQPRHLRGEAVRGDPGRGLDEIFRGRYVPGMTARKWGRVIFISSESAQQIPAEMIHYGMTKTAQVAISRGLAEAL